MEKSTKQEKKTRGIALIIVVGILSLLVTIATYFAINMQLEQKASANYLNSVKAEYLAELGMQKTIADIRDNVKILSYADLMDYITNYSSLEEDVSGIGTYQIFIGEESANTGEDEKVNINTLDNSDSTAIDRLKDLGLSNNDIAAIIDYKDADTIPTTSLYPSTGWVSCTGNENDEDVKNAPFTTLEEIKLVSVIEESVISDTRYNNIKDSITIFGPVIRGGLLAEYYDDITGASPNVSIVESSFVGKVIEPGELCGYYWEDDHLRANGEDDDKNNMPGSDGEDYGLLETLDASWAGFHLLSGVDDYGIGTFGVILEGYIEILADEVGSSVAFYLRCDDGGRLYIDGEEIAESWDDKTAASEVTGSHTFTYAGWHPVRIEYYENQEQNCLELKWDLDGSPATEGSGNYVPAERLGFHPLAAHPVETDMPYNSAGIYKIISLAKVKTGAGKILAEKKLATTLKIFGTLTQTTKEEFCGAWFNDYDNYADGEIRNVTWLNSCPTPQATQSTVANSLKLGYWDDFDEDLAYSAVMLEGTWNVYIEGATSWDDLPLVAHAWSSATYGEEVVSGDPREVNFDDFDGDGDDEFMIKCRGGYDTPYDPTTLNAQKKYAELNYKYYQSTSDFNYDILVEASVGESEAPSARRSWEGDGTLSSNTKDNFNWVNPGPYKTNPPWDYTVWYSYDDEILNPEPGWQPDRWDFTDGSNGFPLDGNYQVGEDCETWPIYRVTDKSSGSIVGIYNTTDEPVTGQYWHGEAPWAVGWLWIRIVSGENGDESPSYIYTLIKDNGTDGGEYELMFDDGFRDRENVTYTNGSKLLTAIGEGDNYYTFLDGSQKTSGTHSPFDSAVALSNNNLFSLLNTNWYSPNAVVWWPNNLPPGHPYSYPADGWATDYVNFNGSNSELEIYWDDMRVIFPKGHLVSAPNFTGYNSSISSADITWGTISFTTETPANTSASLYIRSANNKTDLPTTDTGWSAVTDGQSITDTVTGDWLQYKVDLATDAINGSDYTGSKVTPLLEDITITYLPSVEVLSWREETQ